MYIDLAIITHTAECHPGVERSQWADWPMEGQGEFSFLLLALPLAGLRYSRTCHAGCCTGLGVSPCLLQRADDLTGHLRGATFEEGSELVCQCVGSHFGGSGSDCLGVVKGQ